MMTMAGHYNSHLQLGRTAVSLRGERFSRLYDAVNQVSDGARDKLQLWLALGHRHTSSLSGMMGPLEHLPEVLLQDLVFLQE